MQEGVFITPQEAMEPVLNEARIEYESRLRLKAVKIKLSFPQQIVEEHEYVRDASRGSPRSPLASHRSQAPPRNYKLGNLGKGGPAAFSQAYGLRTKTNLSRSR